MTFRKIRAAILTLGVLGISGQFASAQTVECTEDVSADTVICGTGGINTGVGNTSIGRETVMLGSGNTALGLQSATAGLFSTSVGYQATTASASTTAGSLPPSSRL